MLRCFVLACVASLLPSASAPAQTTDWRVSTGNDASQRYAPLDSIDASKNRSPPVQLAKLLRKTVFVAGPGP